MGIGRVRGARRQVAVIVTGSTRSGAIHKPAAPRGASPEAPVGLWIVDLATPRLGAGWRRSSGCQLGPGQGAEHDNANPGR